MIEGPRPRATNQGTTNQRTANQTTTNKRRQLSDHQRPTDRIVSQLVQALRLLRMVEPLHLDEPAAGPALPETDDTADVREERTSHRHEDRSIANLRRRNRPANQNLGDVVLTTGLRSTAQRDSRREGVT